jgi:hypothetical protein
MNALALGKKERYEENVVKEKRNHRKRYQFMKRQQHITRGWS